MNNITESLKELKKLRLDEDETIKEDKKKQAVTWFHKESTSVKNNHSIVALKEFFQQEEVKDCLLSYNFDKLYSLYENYLNDHTRVLVSSLTYLLYNSNIDPLKYLTSIPNDYACNLKLKNLSGLENIVVSNNIKKIGDDAFYNCSSLKSITISNSVKMIGEFAFQDCKSLTSVNILNGITEIGESIFSNCQSLTSVTIPNSVTKIGHGAFSGCESLTSIIIPDSVTKIDFDAFFDCTSLKTIYCKAPSQPSGWDKDWNDGCEAKIVWGYK